MKKLIGKITAWWYLEGKYYHKDLYRGIKNLRKWFPVIWKDANWDQNYIYKILEHKLKLQSQYIGGRGKHLRANRDAEVMMTCVRLLEKIRENYYEEECISYYEAEYWFEKSQEYPGCSTWESLIVCENLDDYLKKYPLEYKKYLDENGKLPIEGNESEENKKLIVAMAIGRSNQAKALNLLFKLMNTHIERWWD
jgi:hypothetical protein